MAATIRSMLRACDHPPGTPLSGFEQTPLPYGALLPSGEPSRGALARALEGLAARSLAEAGLDRQTLEELQRCVQEGRLLLSEAAEAGVTQPFLHVENERRAGTARCERRRELAHRRASDGFLVPSRARPRAEPAAQVAQQRERIQARRGSSSLGFDMRG